MVDIGAKTDYDALDPDVELKRACCHGGPTRVTSVVGLDIGAKTGYDNTETRMLKRNERAVMAAPSRFDKRMVNAFP